jgi:hypothetical protein
MAYPMIRYLEPGSLLKKRRVRPDVRGSPKSEPQIVRIHLQAKPRLEAGVRKS